MQAQPPLRVPVVFEGKAGAQLFAQICGIRLRGYIVTHPGTLGSCRIPDNGIMIPNSDTADLWCSTPGSILALPGGACPEFLVYRDLYNRREADPLWKTIGPSYTRQFAITSKGGTSLAKGDDLVWVKTWYKDQSRHWGSGNAKVFSAWVLANKADCLAFTLRFLALLSDRYRGGMPKEVIARVLAPLK